MNYEETLWAEIYDDYNQGRHELELAFYGEECKKTKGKCLEIATGTGMILIPLLKEGLDIYGLDVSEQMLNMLINKAKRQGISDIDKRVAKQDMKSFQYKESFDTIIIPARSFLHIISQDDQIQTLKNVRKHLKPNGRLLLNFFTPNYLDIVKTLSSNLEWQHNGDYKKASTGETVNLFFKQSYDPIEQIKDIEWKFIIENMETFSKMKVKWIFKNEFQLLLMTTGFSNWKVYGGFSKEQFTVESREMIWEIIR